MRLEFGRADTDFQYLTTISLNGHDFTHLHLTLQNDEAAGEHVTNERICTEANDDGEYANACQQGSCIHTALGKDDTYGNQHSHIFCQVSQKPADRIDARIHQPSEQRKHLLQDKGDDNYGNPQRFTAPASAFLKSGNAKGYWNPKPRL